MPPTLTTSKSNKSKHLVLTVSVGEKFKQIADITHKSIKQYANKINADFLCINDKYNKSNNTELNNSPHWNKFQINTLLDQYDRILYIDTDIIIREDCPNLFDIVPENKISMFNEGKYETRFQPLEEVVKAYNEKINDWSGEYYNTGVIVISKQHKDLFTLPEVVHELSMFEQSYINLQLMKHKDKYPVFDLDYKFNRMNLMDKLIGESRFASYIIHYAGANQYYEMLTLMENDIKEWALSYPSYNYPRSIIIFVNGNTLHQICSEPTVRYIVTQLYNSKFDDITLVTDRPIIFKHLESYITRVTSTVQPKPDCVIVETNNLNLWRVVRESTIHLMDFISLSAVNRILPAEDKQIRLHVNIKEFKFLNQHIKSFNNLIVINPTNEEWWLSVLIDLQDQNICLIGKSTFKCNFDRVIDLRNNLTFESATALLSKSRVLVSDDSHFVYIASAFETHILLTNADKHSDFIVPFNSSTTHVLYKYFEIDKSPKQIYRQPGAVGERFGVTVVVENVMKLLY